MVILSAVSRLEIHHPAPARRRPPAPPSTTPSNTTGAPCSRWAFKPHGRLRPWRPGRPHRRQRAGNGLGLPGHRPLPRTVAHPARHAVDTDRAVASRTGRQISPRAARRWPPLPLPACACSASSSTNGGATCATGWLRAKPCSRRTTSWNARSRSAPPTCRPPTSQLQDESRRTHPCRAHVARRPGRTGAGRQAGGHRPAVDRHRPRAEPAAWPRCAPCRPTPSASSNGATSTPRAPTSAASPTWSTAWAASPASCAISPANRAASRPRYALCHAVDNALALLDARILRRGQPPR